MSSESNEMHYWYEYKSVQVRKEEQCRCNLFIPNIKKKISHLPNLQRIASTPLYTSVFTICLDYCGQIYIGMMNTSVQVRKKKHQRRMHLNQPGKLVLAEYSLLPNVIDLSSGQEFSPFTTSPT